MIKRQALLSLAQLLQEFPAVALLGPRQVGKTTLAHDFAAFHYPQAVYLDLENPSHRIKLSDPESYLAQHENRLVILDEIQRVPELFSVLRGVIDRRRRQGHRQGQFLMLGSASLDLLRQSSETLAGRIAYKELSGLNAQEITPHTAEERDRLWVRGGFPDSVLAQSDEASFRWRLNFISTYLERDVPQFGPRIPSARLRRLWTMLAHNQGQLLNVSQFAANLGLSVPTTKRYIELLEDLLLIRTLRPWSGNIGKRLVKTPKVYVRDTGLVHALLSLTNLDELLGHPVIGASWEGFVIENLLSVLPTGATAWYYRTAAGAEIDLIVEWNNRKKYAIEIKRSLAPTVSKGFYQGCQDIAATKSFIIYPGEESFPTMHHALVVSLPEIMRIISAQDE
jgi:uncharacterized protein